MDWRGRLETRAAWWTLLAGVPAFVLTALAVPGLAGFGLWRAVAGTYLEALWALAGALVMLRLIAVSVEALGQLWWRRLLRVLAIWGLVAATWPGWWLARG